MPMRRYFIPSENEWYKAAYYNPSSGTYSTYATRSNIAPSNSLVCVPNDANYYNGGYTDSTNTSRRWVTFPPRPAITARSIKAETYGIGTMRSSPVRFGGCVAGRGRYSDALASSSRYYVTPTDEVSDVGFRVASVPEPGSLTLLLACAVGSESGDYAGTHSPLSFLPLTL